LTFSGYQYLGTPDITSIMHPGINYITLRTNDLIFGWVGLDVDIWIRIQAQKLLNNQNLDDSRISNPNQRYLNMTNQSIVSNRSNSMDLST
jgi:hypothetical protein